jgi:hypothetical protein
MRRKNRKQKRTGSKGSTITKAKIVERIAAMMHDVPGVRVKRNVSLPTVDGSGRTREFDVLLTTQVAGLGCALRSNVRITPTLSG